MGLFNSFKRSGKTLKSHAPTSEALKKEVKDLGPDTQGRDIAVEDDHDDAVSFHTVKMGDTLSAIARKTLGSANRYLEIFEANKPMPSHPDKIYPGQVLRIPADTRA